MRSCAAQQAASFKEGGGSNALGRVDGLL